MKILLTGATGYIGSNLVSQLIRLNCDITCVNSSKQLKENSDVFDVENMRPQSLYARVYI